MFGSFYQRRFKGEGGINVLTALALPVIVSEVSETVMMFVDRMFLSRLSPTHMAAAMSGGLTSFMFMTLFFGILGYVNAMVAQHLGAGKKTACSLVVSQALLLLLVFYPLLLACRPLGVAFFRLFNHDAVQLELETTYFGILIFGGIFSLLKVALASFFTGVGRTRVVMAANLFAMVVNIVGNYVLIFGRCGFPAMGIAGAALGTIAGSASCALVLALAYVAPNMQAEFDSARKIRLAWPMMRKFLRFGGPAGIEFLLNMMAFNLLIQVLHSYGREVAAAVTIVFSWDMVSFVPMIGLHVGVMSLVGRYMGSGKPSLAARTAYSGLILVCVYTVALGALFIFTPEPLIRLFIQRGSDDAEILRLAVPMLRLVAVYVLSDGVYLVFSGTLKGAGDTRWSMIASIIVHWLLAGTALILVLWLAVPPLLAWGVFVGQVLILGAVFYLRFAKGKWREIKIVHGGPAEETISYIDVPTIEGSWD